MSKILSTEITVALIRIPPSMTAETGCGLAKHTQIEIGLWDGCRRRLD